MSAIVVSRDVAAPPERVWSLITDLRGAPERLSGVRSVEILSGPDFGVGTRWRETRVMLGKEATEEMTVTSVDPGRSYATEANRGPVKYLSALAVEPTGAGCRLSMTFDAEVGNPLLRVFTQIAGKLFSGQTRKALQRDVDEIATAAERG